MRTGHAIAMKTHASKQSAHVLISFLFCFLAMCQHDTQRTAVSVSGFPLKGRNRLMQEGKPMPLDEEKVAELDSLHFSWEEPVQAVPVEVGIAVSVPMELDVDDDQILAAAEI